MSQTNSTLDYEPYFSFIKESIQKGDTNASIATALEALYDVATSEKSIRRFRKRHGFQVPGVEKASTTIKGDEATATTDVHSGPPILDDPDTMLRQRGLNPEEWYIDAITVNEWDGPQAGGNVVTYYQAKFTAKRIRTSIAGILPVRSDGWLRKPITIRPIDGPQTWVICSDQQAPFHDKPLHEKFLSFLSDQKPHGIINNGDLIDLGDISRHPDDPENEARVNECLQAGYDILRDEIDASPNSHVVLIPGNHDLRIRDLLLNQPKANRVYDLRRPIVRGAEPEHSLHSVQHVLRLDELGVEYVDPNGTYEHAQYKLSKYLAVRHGWVARKGSGASALGTLDTLGYSVIIGHTHRQSIVHKTKADIDGQPITLMAAEAGCMCRIDINPNEEDGRRFPSFAVNPDWQQGFVTATMWPDGFFSIDRAIYVGGSLIYRNKRY